MLSLLIISLVVNLLLGVKVLLNFLSKEDIQIEINDKIKKLQEETPLQRFIESCIYRANKELCKKIVFKKEADNSVLYFVENQELREILRQPSSTWLSLIHSFESYSKDENGIYKATLQSKHLSVQINHDEIQIDIN